ncbi:hypothetical protein [Pseudobacteriovorax antillogorgiicola]|uniref:Lipoprotein-attachment site-containing protein n=1 Tax=Pseudobacteriovorax antillogorgiicola TaxID=1513793 RepID=A0A1Y6B845_9BACT|nr:hypothetical protein [Pseudobacteriovorax antillogorgiicola]TCS59233.1 hypothetical protein EDD56_101136 [Pseudobacteriovorax antillogorgiicola]SME90295.1 hypothetical protein SAMN06296036_101350 [Pseudobacteriovorax antillogorgiicola]
MKCSLQITLLLMLASCGVKTAPRSDVKDLRPSIPYKTPAEPPQDEAKKPQNSKEKGVKREL